MVAREGFSFQFLSILRSGRLCFQLQGLLAWPRTCVPAPLTPSPSSKPPWDSGRKRGWQPENAEHHEALPSHSVQSRVRFRALAKLRAFPRSLLGSVQEAARRWPGHCRTPRLGRDCPRKCSPCPAGNPRCKGELTLNGAGSWAPGPSQPAALPLTQGGTRFPLTERTLGPYHLKAQEPHGPKLQNPAEQVMCYLESEHMKKNYSSLKLLLL